MNGKKVVEYVLLTFALVGTIIVLSNKWISVNTQKDADVEQQKVTSQPKITEAKSLQKPVDDKKKANKLTNAEIVQIQNDVFTEMHHMANTKIIAIDGKIDGTEEITKENISKLKKLIETNRTDCFYGEIYDKLIGILNRWEKGDFSQAVEDHNYIWHQLGGEIGKAIKVK